MTTNKYDVEIQRLASRGEMWRILANGLVIGSWIAASALPLWMVQGIIEPLAGKTTEINATLIASVGVSVSIAVNVAQGMLGQSRKHELRRLRKRVEQFEPQLEVGR